jgi:AraC-like DNA-binding protein
MMNTQIIKPNPRLSGIIDNYMLVDIDWQRIAAQGNTSLASVWRLIPYGKVSMLFVYGDTHEYSLEGATAGMQKTRQAFLVGQLTKPIWLKFSGHTRLIKIQFKPGALSQLLPMELDEFTNVPSLDLEAVWGRAAGQLVERIHEAGADHDRIALLDAFFDKRLQARNNLVDYVEYTLTQLQQAQGKVSIKGLEDKLGISTRQLERLFLSKVGLSPKQMSKIIRLNGAFSQLEAQPSLSMTSLSYELGYHDQAHFCHDFKAIAGVSPSKLFSQSSGELFVTHGQCFMKQKSAVSTARKGKSVS